MPRAIALPGLRATEAPRDRHGAIRARLLEHLRVHGGRYLGVEHGAVRVSADPGADRAGKRLFTFDVAVEGRRERLLVKMQPEPHAASRRRRVFARPLIAPTLTPDAADRLEFAALSRIHGHFTELGDARFGTVAMYARLDDPPAIVMQRREEPDLRTRWLSTGLLDREAGASLSAAFSNAGAWLAEYHRMPRDPGLPKVQTRRSEFQQFTDDHLRYLADQIGDDRWFRRIWRSSSKVARAQLPVDLPCGLEHGDYALRNILVGPQGQATVIDTFSRYETAIYRDIGYFLGSTRCSLTPAVLRGAVGAFTRREAYRQAFITGYFGSAPVPWAVVHLYEMQYLLERWAARVAQVRAQGRGSDLRARLRMTAWSTWFSRAVAGRLAAAKRAAAAR